MSENAPHYHAVVWIDHEEAKLFFFGRDAFDKESFSSHEASGRLHHKKGSISGFRRQPDRKFFEQIAETLNPAKEWMLVGPGTAKTEFESFVWDVYPDLAARLKGIVTVDHPTDAQIVNRARLFFRQLVST